MIPLLTALGAVAAAQSTAVERAVVPEIDAQTFRPTLDRSGFLVVDTAARPAPGGHAQVLLSYHDDLLVYLSEGEQVGIVRNLVQANVLAAWGAGPVRVGVDAPVYFFAKGDATGGEAGLGDVALDGRVTVAGEGTPLALPVDLGVQARTTLPTATVDNALGARLVTWSVGLLVSKDLGPLQVAADVATVGGPAASLENIEVNDALSVAVGGRLRASEAWTLSGELASRFSYRSPVSNLAGVPLELLVGSRVRVREDLSLRAAVGRGLSPGIGAPDLRVIAGVELSAPRR